jgi:hypothetical protein
MALYDTIGKTYAQTRKSNARIAKKLLEILPSSQIFAILLPSSLTVTPGSQTQNNPSPMFFPFHSRSTQTRFDNDFPSRFSDA